MSSLQELPPFIQFDILSRYSELVTHFSSTRHGGVSTAACHSLNLGFQPSDSPANVVHNRHRLAAAAGFEVSSMCLAQQVHGNHIVIVDQSLRGAGLHNSTTGVPACDALITRTPDVCIAVHTADCTPILLYDTYLHAVAAIHAGWRGTVAQITLRTVQAMQRLGSQPEHMVAAIGPCIGVCCYEVGPEVSLAVQQALPNAHNLLHWHAQAGKHHLHLKQANLQQLLQAGIPAHQIEVSPHCTQCEHTHFFSSRHHHGHTGRMLTGIVLR